MNKREFKRLAMRDLKQNGNILGLCETSRDENSIKVFLDHVMGPIGQALHWKTKPSMTGEMTLQPLVDTIYHRIALHLKDEKLGLQFDITAKVVLINHAYSLNGTVDNTNDGLSMHSLMDGRYVFNIRLDGAEIERKIQESCLKPENWRPNSDGSHPLSQKLVNNICEAFPESGVFQLQN